MTEIQTIKAKKPLVGSVDIPADKSISHRYIMISAITNGDVEIENLLESEDIFSTINAFISMGVKIEKGEYEDGEKFWKVHGVGLNGLKKPSKALDMGNSGTSVRLIMGILAGQDFEAIVDGDASLRKRPMERVTEPLSQMGAKFEFLEKDGCLPIKIIGNPNLKPLVNYEMPVASAQIKSAILFAGLYADGETSIIERKPSRNHTEGMFRVFGIDVKTEKNTIKLKPAGIFGVESRQEFVISDPSSAAFFIAAALLIKDSQIDLGHMSINETRIGFVNALDSVLGIQADAFIEAEEDDEPFAHNVTFPYIEIKKKEYTIPAEYAPRMIDEYPILAVLAAGSEATIRMEGIGELRVKESDRIAVMQKGLEACGVKVESGEDWMEVRGTGKVKGGARIETHLDHRIAMSFIILGLIAEEPIIIDDISPIQTSFPNFFTELKKLGVDYGI